MLKNVRTSIKEIIPAPNPQFWTFLSIMINMMEEMMANFAAEPQSKEYQNDGPRSFKMGDRPPVQ